MKKWIIRLVLVALVLVVIGAVALYFSLNTIVKGGVEKVGPAVTKTDVKLDAANLSPFSGKGQLTGLFVGNPEGFQTPSAIKVGDIKVHVKVKSVFSDIVMVESIEIESPEITYEGTLTGSNIKTLLDNITSVAGASESKAPEEKPAEGGKKLKVVSLLIKNPRVNVSAKGLGGKAATLTIPDIHLTNIGMDGDGVSTAELSRQVIKEILAGVVKALPQVTGVFGESIKDIGNKGVEGVKDATKGLKNLFKK